MLPRRGFLVLTASSASNLQLANAFAKGDFWNTKASDEWSADDIRKLMTKSPWAREVTTATNMDSMQGGRGGGRGGRGGRGGGMGGGADMGGGGGMGGMGGGGGRGGGMGGGGMEGDGGGGMGGAGGMGSRPEIKALIRWESAGPIRAARKKELPEAEKSYILSVSGMPMMGGGGRRGAPEGGGQQPQDPEQRRRMMADRLKQSTTLAVKGKDPAAPDGVRLLPVEQSAMAVFAFSRDALKIEPPDKEVTFSTRMGPMEVKAKFVLKDMLYQGKLEL